MKRRIALIIAICLLIPFYVQAAPIRWVNFDVPYESLKFAMNTDIGTAEKEQHISWIDILAVAACRSGGKCPLKTVQRAADALMAGESPEQILGGVYKYYDYYRNAYKAVLGGLLGHYAVCIDGQWKTAYGLKAFSPIAAGYGYSHCADFGNQRSYGFSRKHLGNDLMGTQGTPIIAVEGGVVEALGWNRYGGWRVGIRSFDSKRYYYYAHLQKDKPFAKDLQEGDIVQAGDVIGFMGRTGYSDKENVNNIETVHLHFGIQLIFDESQKECLSEIWIDAYDIVRLLGEHRSSVQLTDGSFYRKHPFVDLDIDTLPGH